MREGHVGMGRAVRLLASVPTAMPLASVRVLVKAIGSIGSAGHAAERPNMAFVMSLVHPA